MFFNLGLANYLENMYETMLKNQSALSLKF